MICFFKEILSLLKIILLKIMFLNQVTPIASPILAMGFGGFGVWGFGGLWVWGFWEVGVWFFLQVLHFIFRCFMSVAYLLFEKYATLKTFR